MKYTANQAAKVTGRAVPTITRAIKSGKLSADRDGKNLVIDAAELFRVFPPATPIRNDVIDESYNALEHVTAESNNNFATLQRENEMLRERLQDKDGVIQDLRTDRDHWRDLAETTTRLLPAPAPQTSLEPKRSWWNPKLW